MVNVLVLLVASQVASADGSVGAFADRVGPIEKLLQKWKSDSDKVTTDRDKRLFERLRVQSDEQQSKLFGLFKSQEKVMQGIISDWRKERAKDLAEKAEFDLRRKELQRKEQAVKIEIAKARRAEVWAKIIFAGSLAALAATMFLIVRSGGIRLLLGRR